MRVLVVIVMLLAACSNRTERPVPDNAARLSVATCIEPLDRETPTTEFRQQLRPRGELRLFASPDLSGPLGGVNSDLVYGRMNSDTVWGVLVADFEGAICEAYVGVETVVPTGETFAVDVGVDG